MPGKEQAFRPSVSDAALKAATAKDWAGWFAVLDRAKASALSHKDIARLIVERHKIPGWWARDHHGKFRTRAGLARAPSEGGRSILCQCVENFSARCCHALPRRCEH